MQSEKYTALLAPVTEEIYRDLQSLFDSLAWERGSVRNDASGNSAFPDFAALPLFSSAKLLEVIADKASRIDVLLSECGCDERACRLQKEAIFNAHSNMLRAEGMWLDEMAAPYREALGLEKAGRLTKRDVEARLWRELAPRRGAGGGRRRE